MEWLLALAAPVLGLVLGPLTPLIGGLGAVGVLAWFGLRGSLGSFFKNAKVWLIIGGVVAIFGIFAYHNSVVANLREDVATLTRNNATLEASNQSLERSMEQTRTNLRDVLTELANVRAADAAARNELSAVQQALRSSENRARQTRLRNEAAGVETVVREANLDSRCRAANFGRSGGACRNGVWVPAQ